MNILHKAINCDKSGYKSAFLYIVRILSNIWFIYFKTENQFVQHNAINRPSAVSGHKNQEVYWGQVLQKLIFTECYIFSYFFEARICELHFVVTIHKAFLWLKRDSAKC
jgi:hypothetical protein